MRNNDARQGTDDLERWMQTRVAAEKVTFDASLVDPGVQSLRLDTVQIPDGALAELEQLESLVIIKGSAERIDLRGCTSLRHLSISYVRGLTEIVGIDELTTLEELDLYALPRIEWIPPLERLTELWRLDVGSMKGLKSGLAPFLAAPNLREIQLQSSFVIAPGDAELLRDHPRVVGFSWFDAKSTSAAGIRHLFNTAARRSALLRKEGRPAEHEVPPQRLSETAPEHMVQIAVSSRGESGVAGGRLLNGLGDALLDGEHDFGPGLRQIRVALCAGEHRPAASKIKLQQAKGVLSIEYPSDLTVSDHPETSPEVFSRAASEVIAALEAARMRVIDEIPEFAFDALLDRCRSIHDRMPQTAADVDALIEQAGLRAKTLRVAMSRVREMTANPGSA